MSRRTLVVAGTALVAAFVTAGALAFALTANSSSPGLDGRQTVAAPIDGLEISVLESNPPQYVVRIKAGLPSGCAKQHSHAIARAGDIITVTVLNSMPTGNPVCTMIYGTYDLNLNLGSDFRSGTTYTVRVNDQVKTFTAQ